MNKKIIISLSILAAILMLMSGVSLGVTPSHATGKVNTINYNDTTTSRQLGRSDLSSIPTASSLYASHTGSPNAFTTTSLMKNKSQLEDLIGLMFVQWYDESHSYGLAMMNSSSSGARFREFVGQNKTAAALLEVLSSLEQRSYSSLNPIQPNISLIKEVTDAGIVIRQMNVSTNTSRGIYSDQSKLYAATINGIQYEAWKVYITTPKGTVIDPWVWVNINYYVYTAPWWLGGWSITYGELDNYYTYYTGPAAQSFFNAWESTTSNEGYALAVIGLLTLAVPTPITAAIGAALTIAGIGLIYEGATMVNYYESTGFSYILLDFVNNYYYPWVVTPLGSLASSFGLYGIDWNEGSYTFWYNVPYVVYGGILGVMYGAEVSNYCHQFVNNYGSGTWVWFN